MRVLGCDPGLSGGLCVISDDTVLDARPMLVSGGEVDFGEVADYMRIYDPDVIALEKVAAMPKQGVVSMFTFGSGYGGIRGAAAALGLRLELCTPQAWKKIVLAGTAKDKDAAIAYVRRAYPAVALYASERSRVPHSGIADAVCIAAFGLRVFGRPV